MGQLNMEHGLSLRVLAKVMGVSPSTLQRDIAKQDELLEDGRRMVQVSQIMGLDGKVRPSRRTDTTERDLRIRQLRADGLSIRQVADSVGCSVGTVHRVLKS